MLTITKTSQTTKVLIDNLGYEYDYLSNTVLLPNDKIFTITNDTFGTYTLSTKQTSNVESTYMIVETTISSTMLLPIDLYIDSVRATITPSLTIVQAVLNKVYVAFVKIYGYNNLVMIVQNLTQDRVQIKFRKNYLSLYGNHVNNVDGQIIGNSKIVDEKVNVIKQCILVEEQRGVYLFNLPKLKHKLIMTQDINYYTFNINGDLGL